MALNLVTFIEGTVEQTITASAWVQLVNRKVRNRESDGVCVFT